MKIIVQAFSRAWMLDMSVSTVKVNLASELLEDSGHDDDDGETIKYDPRSTTAAHLERRSDLEDLYGRERNTFGFGHGREK